jgi:hypothetical protein
LVITDYATAEFDEFTLPLGKVEEEKPVKSQHLEGKITRIEYAGPVGRSILKIYRNDEAAFQKAGFSILFTCVNDDGCGNGVVALYKRERRLELRSGTARPLGEIGRKEGDVYICLHVGQWTNWDKGSDTVLYVIEVKPMEGDKVTVDAVALASDMSNTGDTAVYGIYFDTGKAEVKPASDAAL